LNLRNVFSSRYALARETGEGASRRAGRGTTIREANSYDGQLTGGGLGKPKGLLPRPAEKRIAVITAKFFLKNHPAQAMHAILAILEV